MSAPRFSHHRTPFPICHLSSVICHFMVHNATALCTMKSLWNDQDAARFKTDLEQRVYTSRLLGRDSSLVLHGGGNTSVKLTKPNLFGESVDLLYVKGSGWDLASIEAPRFAPVRLDHLLHLSPLPHLTISPIST